MNGKLKYIILLLVACATVFSSCRVSSDDIRMDSMDGVEIDGVTLSQARITLKMTMANDSKARVKVRDGELTLLDDRGKVAEVFMDEPLVLARRTTTALAIPLVLRFGGAMGSVTAMPRLADLDKLRVSGTIHIKGGMIGKKWRVEDMPVKDFLHMLGVSGTESLNLSL